jgi:hypothetical protein
MVFSFEESQCISDRLCYRWLNVLQVLSDRTSIFSAFLKKSHSLDWGCLLGNQEAEKFLPWDYIAVIDLF